MTDKRIQDIQLTKGGYRTGDYLSWSYKGKIYDCTGQFYVDRFNKLHHIFITPDTGEDIEIVVDYVNTPQ